MATKRKPPNRATFTVEIELFGGSSAEVLERYWVSIWEKDIRHALNRLDYIVKSIKTTVYRKPVR